LLRLISDVAGNPLEHISQRQRRLKLLIAATVAAVVVVAVAAAVADVAAVLWPQIRLFKAL